MNRSRTDPATFEFSPSCYHRALMEALEPSDGFRGGDVAAWQRRLRRGIAALCLEQRSFGERREPCQKSVSSHGCHDATMQALMLGKTLLGERVCAEIMSPAF